MIFKFFVTLILIVAYSSGSSYYFQSNQIEKTDLAMKQMKDFKIKQDLRLQTSFDNNIYVCGWIVVFTLVFLLFLGDLRKMFNKLMLLAVVLLVTTGCRRPFEPIKLEVINSNEEAFLLPYTGDSKKQAASDNEEYLKANLVYTQQVQIPQQWVQKGHETFGPNGAWQDAATLIKVDKSPVTREWTADPMSGTSNKNEAIWVMTSDQVEFSTGWTCVARISSRDDAVKFLHNYPNGSLTKVLDSEVRSQIQADFGLEVTDLPMDVLRKSATPHITKVTSKIVKTFKEKGITITNLGISGGFVYKDKTILATMVKVFNAEQEKAVAAAESAAQQERNKKVIFKATGEADALLKTKKAEADGVKMIADAKLYEIEKASDKFQVYIQLKQLELQRELLMKWNGEYPRYFMSNGNSPNMLLQLPPIVETKK